ncbi:MAG TPA: NAD(P)-dependent oxidoreductase [Candidatus Limnocylindrales bacterium]|nr:NAD(P)-dependent oxidoreductase [Candidatus Limnocylindrales bacterium]
MTGNPTVIVDPHFRPMREIFTPADEARLHELAQVVWGKDTPMPLEAFNEAVPQASAVVCADWRYGDDALRSAEKLRAVLTVSGGFPRQIDYDVCFTRGIRVLSAAPAFARSVAEMALALALAAGRDIVSGDRAMRAGNEHWLHAGNRDAFMLFGKPVGFIGYGSIARELQPLLTPFAVTISANDPWLSDAYLRRCGIRPAALDDVLSQSRVIFVLAAPSHENKALLSAEKLALIAPDAVLVLVSRAHVVDFDALAELAAAGRFKVAIDVFPEEPLAADHPLRRAEKAILSPHKAGPTVEGCHEIGQMIVEDLEAILQGLPPTAMQSAQPELIYRYATQTIRQRK